MNEYLALVGPGVASVVAVGIAVVGDRRNTRRERRDKQEAARHEQAKLVGELLELHLDAQFAKHMGKHDARMIAILLQLPGHLATILRHRLKRQHTMKDVPLDPASAARLRSDEPHDAGHKWLIFDRASKVRNRALAPYPEWVEAELAYDIAGLRGQDQDAVLTALSHDPRPESNLGKTQSDQPG